MSKSIAISKIKVDGGTQSRAGTNGPIVYEYAELMQAGVKFPPIVVYHDGEEYWLADGFHRVAAAKEAKLKTIMADVQQGTRRDAVLHSVGANAEHGLRRTNSDKYRAVEMLLRDEEWAKWSDREIARRVGVSPTFVGNIRLKITPSVHDGQIGDRIVRRGDTEYAMNTAPIAEAHKPPTVTTPEGKATTLTPSSAGKALSTQPASPVIADERMNQLHPLKQGDRVRTPDGLGKIVSLRWAEGRPHVPPTYTVRLAEGSRLQRYKRDQLEFVPTPPQMSTSVSRPVTRTTSYEDGYVPDVPDVHIDEVDIDERPAGMVYTLPIKADGLNSAEKRLAANYPAQALMRLRLLSIGTPSPYPNVRDDMAEVQRWLDAVDEYISYEVVPFEPESVTP